MRCRATPCPAQTLERSKRGCSMGHCVIQIMAENLHRTVMLSQGVFEKDVVQEIVKEVVDGVVGTNPYNQKKVGAHPALRLFLFQSVPSPNSSRDLVPAEGCVCRSLPNE
jgi:hypothetical protein